MPRTPSPAHHAPAPAPRRDRAASRRSLSRRRRRRRTFLALALVAAVLLLGADLIRRGLSADLSPTAATAGEPSPVVASAPAPTAAAPPSAPPTSAAPLLTASASFPRSGPGTWVYAASPGPILGTAGTVRRFRLAIETGVPQDAVAFAAKVDRTLGDPRSWTAGRTFRLQRVQGAAAAEFTIYLATPETARRLCASGFVDIRVNGVPYTSCRVSGKVVINLARWMMSVPDYVNNGVPLEDYRAYVINHETGHQLGYGHEACPGAGRPAPVMQTQTLGLHGCLANAWPYLNGRRYVGPPAAR
jgi:hypothetical protein